MTAPIIQPDGEFPIIEASRLDALLDHSRRLGGLVAYRGYVRSDTLTFKDVIALRLEGFKRFDADALNEKGDWAEGPEDIDRYRFDANGSDPNCLYFCYPGHTATLFTTDRSMVHHIFEEASKVASAETEAQGTTWARLVIEAVITEAKKLDVPFESAVERDKS